jgi:glycosyltransferase involved in cell wall biosynthesis
VARRLYFVQDYEPFFFAHGFEYALAEDSYRFGFRTIALGHMVARHLADKVGVKADVVEFSCDTDVYHLAADAAAPRAGVVWYARPGASRRGYALSVLALEAFHAQHPEQPIHVYGESPVGLPFPVVHHGRLTPQELNELYGQVVAGLAMSFTNVSLVAEEMLASGVVPVINDSPDARADLQNEHAVWARPTPRGIADALAAALVAPDPAARAAAASASVRRDSWRDTAARTADIVEDEVRGPD